MVTQWSEEPPTARLVLQARAFVIGIVSEAEVSSGWQNHWPFGQLLDASAKRPSSPRPPHISQRWYTNFCGPIFWHNGQIFRIFSVCARAKDATRSLRWCRLIWALKHGPATPSGRLKTIAGERSRSQLRLQFFQ